MERVAWVTGDQFGLPIPADAAALIEGGAGWLTRAVRAAGMPDDAAVARIVRAEPLEAGGSGTKLILDVARDDGTADALFVKFSRHFGDPARDAPRFHMAPEVRLALLARAPGFPVAVPECLFADFHAASGTGVLITRRIVFGEGAIEPQHAKCLDHVLPDALGHYRALIRATARLAGAHKAGRLPARVAAEFPFDHEAALAADRIPYSAARIRNRVARLAAFAAEFPRLLPAHVRDPGFLARFGEDAEAFLAREDAIKRLLHADPDLIALCHWNANIDNAWFWRGADGVLECGLLDWGSVGQMHVAMTLWGCLSGAETALWDAHLDDLVALFVATVRDEGGPAIDPAVLTRHLFLYAAMMGLAWLLDAPPRIRAEGIDLAAVTGPHDPRFTARETARVQLQMLTNLLNLWATRDVGGAIRAMPEG